MCDRFGPVTRERNGRIWSEGDVIVAHRTDEFNRAGSSGTRRCPPMRHETRSTKHKTPKTKHQTKRQPPPWGKAAAGGVCAVDRGTDMVSEGSRRGGISLPRPRSWGKDRCGLRD